MWVSAGRRITTYVIVLVAVIARGLLRISVLVVKERNQLVLELKSMEVVIHFGSKK
jgi:hypothetical protein